MNHNVLLGRTNPKDHGGLYCCGSLRRQGISIISIWFGSRVGLTPVIGNCLASRQLSERYS